MRKDGKSGYQHLKEIEQRYKDLMFDIETILQQEWAKETPKEMLAKVYIKYRSLDR